MDDFKKNVLVLALYAGEIMLKNGAETYRVEDTIIRICRSFSIPHVESFVTPTGIFVSVDSGKDDDDVFTFIKRIQSRSIDLNKVSKVNDFSRKLSTSSLSIKEQMKLLKGIDALPKYSRINKALGSGMASSFFGLLLGATYYDFIASFLIASMVYLVISFVERLESNLFIQNLIGGACTAILAIGLLNIHLGNNLDKIIIGSIMILVPGVPITNAIRDYISGELLSGVARSMEAIIIAIAIALGVGSIMNMWIYLFGGIIL